MSEELAWETAQKKAFTHWVNTILSKRNLGPVDDLVVAFSDGITIVHLLELLCNKRVPKIKSNPMTKIHKLQNTHICLEFLKDNGVHPKYLTISSENFIDGDIKLLLGFIWVLFRKFHISKNLGSEDFDKTNDTLLTWVRDTTSAYAGVNIVDFKNSFCDGNAILALLHQMDSTLFDYDERVSEHPSIENLQFAFDIAEKHFNVPQLLKPEDIAQGSFDERALVLFISLLLHTLTSLQEKKQIKDEHRVAAEKLIDVEMQMEILNKKVLNKETEYKNLQSLYQEKEHAYDCLVHEKEEVENQVEDLRHKYSLFKQRIDEQVKLEMNALGILRKNIIEHLRDMSLWKNYLNQDQEFDSMKVQIRTEKEISSRPVEDQLEFLSEALTSENKKLLELMEQCKLEEKRSHQQAPGDLQAPAGSGQRSEGDQPKAVSSKKSKPQAAN